MINDIYNFQDDTCYDENGNPIPCPPGTPEGSMDIPKEWVHDQNIPKSFEPILEGEPPGGTIIEEKEQVPTKHPYFTKSSFISEVPNLMLRFFGNETRDVNLLEENTATLEGYRKLQKDKGNSFVNNIFAAAGETPSGVFETDLERAQELLNSPKIQNSEKTWDSVYEPYIDYSMLSARIANGIKIMNDDAYKAAEQADAAASAKGGLGDKIFTFEVGYGNNYTVALPTGIHTLLFDNVKDNSTKTFVNKDQYNKKLLGYYNSILDGYKQAYPLDQWKAEGHSEGQWRLSYDRLKEQLNKSLKEYNYENATENMIAFYNNGEVTKGVNKLTAVGQAFNPFRKELGNVGGGIQAVPYKIEYNMDKNQRKNDDGTYKEEALEFVRLLKLANKNKDKISIGLGSVKGEISDDFKDKGVNLFSRIMKDIKANDNLPYGNIQFQDIAGNKGDYHAYNITFDKDFLDKYKGTKDKNDILYNDYESVLNNGITIYVPKDISEKSTRFGKVSAKFKTNSNSGISAILNTVGEYKIDIPNTGSLIMRKDKDKNTITVSGVKRILNSKTLNYDEDDMDGQVIENANAADVYSIYNKYLDELKFNFQTNMKKRNLLLQIQNSGE